MYNIANNLIFNLKTSSSAYLTTLHRELCLKRNSLQFTDIQSTTITMSVFMSFIAEREEEEVDETLNETLKIEVEEWLEAHSVLISMH